MNVFEKIKDFFKEYIDCFLIIFFNNLIIFIIVLFLNENDVFNNWFIYFVINIITIPIVPTILILFRNILYINKRIKEFNSNIRANCTTSELFHGKLVPNIIIYNIGIILALLLLSILYKNLLISIYFIFFSMTIISIVSDFIAYKINKFPIILFFSLITIPCKFHWFDHDKGWKSLSIAIRSISTILFGTFVLSIINKYTKILEYIPDIPQQILSIEETFSIILNLNMYALLFCYIMMDERRNTEIIKLDKPLDENRGIKLYGPKP